MDKLIEDWRKFLTERELSDEEFRAQAMRRIQPQGKPEISDPPEEPEEEQEVIDGYHNWIDSMHNLKDYAYYSLHTKTPAQRSSMLQSRRLPSMGYDKYVHAYDFIKDWVGGE